LNYAYKEGTAGTVLQPALAAALPTVSANKLVYSVKLRSGLKYSDGSAIKASDFTHGVERAIKISWGGKSFFTGYIKGAAAYDAGKATSISGIKTNDATGAITITLTQPYGAFDNILAFEAGSPVPASTPFKVLSNTPPIGDGPYKFGKIVPNASYTLVKNPQFAGLNIPNIPAGFVDTVQVTVDSNNVTEAQEVINNQADVFDPGDELPPTVLSTINTQAAGRYTKEQLASVYYFFLNTKVAPFNNTAVRQAVSSAVDRTALARVSAGSLVPGCFFLPPTIVGHNTGSCASGDPNTVPSAATVAKAKAAIAHAGLAGTKVTVWSETRSPRQAFCAYFADLLTKLGFKASLKVVADSVYFQTIGNQKLNAQTGFADWSQDFPNPSDFYLLLSKAGIQATNNENFGNVDDPKLESQLAKLQVVPASSLTGSTAGWQALDKYVDQQAYTIPYGYAVAPKLMSNRVNFSSSVFNSVNYLLYNTVSLK
jgi:peptide/nickel transport system substrate-binding protein